MNALTLSRITGTRPVAPPRKQAPAIPSQGVHFRPWQVGQTPFPEPAQDWHFDCCEIFPLPPHGEQPILPPLQEPHASVPRPAHLLHWILTSSTFPTPSSATSPVPLHRAQEKAPVPLHVPHWSAPEPAQELQAVATTTIPFAPQVPQETAPEPEQVRQTGGGGGGGSFWMT
jgi:hypothetical protein